MSDPWARPDPADEPHPADDTDRPSGAAANGSHAPSSSHHGTNGTTGVHGNGHADPELARTFGRPVGVDGGFSRSERAGRSDRTGRPAAPPAPPALAAAFGRPEQGTETLQRPQQRRTESADDGTWWSRDADRDPWRDPDSAPRLGGPALGDPEARGTSRTPGPRLSARELLFGRRVAPTALILLAVIALVIGAVGGVVGYAVAGGTDELTDPGATLAEVTPGKERPPGSVADVAARVVPAVVSLEVRTGTTGDTGSGVVIDADGHILTNNHVVAQAATDPQATLDAVFASGLRAPARVVGRDPLTDLAVVKVNVANPRVAQLGRSADLRAGDSVIAIGSPLGLAGTVTEGIVSSVRRPVRLEAADASESPPAIDAIQTDAAINPGNSGGALVDSTGAVVGINSGIRTLGQTGEGGSIGLGFAIPIDDARATAESLIRTGSVTHADLGVNAKSVTGGTAAGAQVLNVRQGGAGARAGLAEGDIVLRVDDRPIASADELTVAIQEHRPGDRVTLSIVRGGRPLSLQAML